METTIRVFLTDPSRDYLDLLCSALAQQEDFVIAGTAVTGDRAAEAFPTANADLLLTELLLPGLDGISLLRRLKAQGCLRHSIVLSGFYNAQTARTVSELADNYLSKPCRTEDLIRHMREAVHGRSDAPGYNDDVVVGKLLLDFGIPPHLDGYAYLRDSIPRILDDRTLLRGVTKALYRETAKHFGTTPTCVERSIRAAIRAGWDRSSQEERYKYFGTLFERYTKAPSNLPFLTAITEYIDARSKMDYRLFR